MMFASGSDWSGSSIEERNLPSAQSAATVGMTFKSALRDAGSAAP
jgi:hypothetical protein